LRTTLTLLSILVAFMLFGILSAPKLALAGGGMADANRLIVRHRVSFIQPLPHSYQARIARIPGVRRSPIIRGSVALQGPQTSLAALVEPELFLATNPEISLPAPEKEAWLKTRTGAVIGRALATRFN
jgi:putative ABC transport system permease protein